MASKVKSSEEATVVIQQIEEIIRSKKWNNLWLPYWQGKIFEKYQADAQFINMINQLGTSN